MMTRTIRTYTELSQLQSFSERFRYLSLGGIVGRETFGLDRYLNQMFYNSYEWKHIRQQVIIRDNGCDLGILDVPIFGRILIHHMNPVAIDDILDRTDYLLNPEYLISVSHDTHNAIHYGDINLIKNMVPVERKPNDQCPWRK